MIIDFRVRVPYKMYEGSNLFSMVDFTEPYFSISLKE